jgi:hypothetical protein
VNTGQLNSVLGITNRSGHFVAVAGVSNDFREAILAVIDPSSATSVAPAGPQAVYRCNDCPSEGPCRYYRFPRSELSYLESPEPYNNASRLVAQEDGFQILVTEFSVTKGEKVGFVYEFTREFAPVGFFPASGYKMVHERLSREGRLKHAVSECPELTKPRKLSVWSRETKSWSDVYIPPMER